MAPLPPGSAGVSPIPSPRAARARQQGQQGQQPASTPVPAPRNSLTPTPTRAAPDRPPPPVRPPPPTDLNKLRKEQDNLNRRSMIQSGAMEGESL